MKRKIIAALCFTLMIASLVMFAGCGGSSGSGTSSSSVSSVSPLPSPSVDCGGESCIN